MARWTSKLLAKPWHVALSVALLSAVGTGTGLVITRHHHVGIQVRVLGEQFQNNSSGSASTGGASAAKPTGNTSNGKPISFTLSAQVSGLVLGQSATLPVQITNPMNNGGTLVVNTITVTPQDIVANGTVICAASNLVINDYDASQAGASVHAVPKGQTGTVGLPIILQDSRTVDETLCRGKSFSLSVTGTATVTHP